MSYKFGLLILAAVHVCTTSALPPCVCTRNLKPVCGSDGVTYANECLLDCQRSKTNSDLSLAKEGSCEDDLRVPNTCICTLEYRPVCGTDGKTYPNRCSLTCERSTPSIEVKYEGQCVEEEIKVAGVPLCECTREKKLVCGSDGATYSNPCLLNCATQNNPGLKVEHAGPCDNSVKVVEQPYPKSSPTCACTRNLKPVCGSDGVTYNNVCLLRCAGENLTVVKEAPCDN